jgi:hypothetical protein
VSLGLTNDEIARLASAGDTEFKTSCIPKNEFTVR